MQRSLLAFLAVLLSLPSPAQAGEKTAERPPAAEPFALVALPDTQIYAERHPEHFHAQTRWIAENAGKLGLRFVVQLGDVTNRGGRKEWAVARAAMERLDGVVDWALVPGNHDSGFFGTTLDRKTLFTEYFPLSKFAQRKSFGGVFDREPARTENSYHLFEAWGRKWLLLCLEFGPRDAVVEWAAAVVERHPDRSALLVTHAYLYDDGARYDWATHGNKQGLNPHAYGIALDEAGVNDGEELWRKLVSKTPNFVLTLNGHVAWPSAARRSSVTPHGNAVHQLLVNFQAMEEGGQGWLRLLQFQPDGKTLRVRDYSPVLDRYAEAPAFNFELEIAGPPPAAPPPEKPADEDEEGEDFRAE